MNSKLDSRGLVLSFSLVVPYSTLVVSSCHSRSSSPLYTSAGITPPLQYFCDVSAAGSARRTRRLRRHAVIGAMHLLAGLGLMLAQVPPTKAVPATSTSKDMYGFWCTPARMSSILCQHHDLIAKMGAAKVRPSRRAVAPHT